MPAKPGYLELEKLLLPIVGGEIEHVTVLVGGQRADMFVNELGHVLSLPRNELATAIYRTNTLTQQPKTDPAGLPWIVGPAVLFERIVWY